MASMRVSEVKEQLSMRIDHPLPDVGENATDLSRLVNILCEAYEDKIKAIYREQFQSMVDAEEERGMGS